MRRETAICVGMAALVLGGLALISGCQSAGDEAGPPVNAEPVIEAAPEVVAPPADTPVPVEAGEKDEVAGEADVAVKLALTFVPGRATTYKVTTEAAKSVKWEGNMAKKPAVFKDGRTGHHVEMTFDQQVERLADNGHAVVKVTIKALKYLGQSHGNVVLDFDSARPSDQDNPMAALIGQAYKVEMTPRGQVVALVDINAAREAVEGITPGHRTAARLLSDKAIRERHEVAALTTLESEAVRPAEHWSNEATFAFGMLGNKAYERVYTLERVEREGDAKEAVVVMRAIPSVAGVGAAHQGQAPNQLMGMFDSTDSYSGRLRFDLNAGQVRAYSERLETEWVTADPAAVQRGDTNPAVLRMSAIESYKLERIE